MRYLYFLLFLACGSLSAQSLLQDAQRLTAAVAVLQDTTADTTGKGRAFGEMIATLHYYDAKIPKTGLSSNPADILSAYRDNNTINSLIGELPAGIDADLPGFQTAFLTALDTLASGPRQSILELLYADQATTAGDYLALLKTIREYQEPPLDAISALQAPAAAKDENAGTGSLFNEAAILRGLFSFLIERAGEELVVSFLDRLLGKQLPTVAKLFPTTLNLYGQTDYAYSDAFLSSLRDAFLEDLRMLDVRLPELLLTDELFAELQADPVFYSILTAYTVVALTQSDEMPLEQAVPLVARDLHQRYRDTEKQRNLLLAETAPDSPEYRAVIAAVQQVVARSVAVYDQANVAENKLADLIEALSDDADVPFALRMQLLKDTEALENNSKRFERVFKTGPRQEYDLLFVPSLLEGELPVGIMGALTTLKSYDRYYADPTSPQSRRAAGLALARRMAGLSYDSLTLDTYFAEWRDSLLGFQNVVAEAQLAAKTEATLLNERKNNLALAKEALSTALTAARTQWDKALTEDERTALRVLNNVVEDAGQFSPATPLDEVQKITAQENTLVGVRQRLDVLHRRILSRSPGIQLAADPIADYFAALDTSARPLAAFEDETQALRADLLELRKRLAALDDAYARNLTRSRANAKPLMQTGDMLGHLLFLLRNTAPDSTEQHFITLRELQTALLSPSTRSAFLGLMEQNMNRAQYFGTFSAAGLSSLLLATVQDMTLLPTRVKATPDSLQFYQRSAFVVNALNRVLETPLIVEPLQPDSVYALTDKWPALRQVPAISRDVLDLVYYMSTKDYRQALTQTLETTIRLSKEYERTIDLKEKDPEKREKLKAQRKTLHFFQQYGDFIGGLVDADSARQVHALLDAISDPPGGSRIKRLVPYTAGINAYVGGLYGWETLRGSQLGSDSTYRVFAPSMPIGVNFSFLVFRRQRHPPSFSLFLSVLDIGSLATYNLNQELPGDNQLTFRNVLKPGVQFQWNIPKSPFFLGAGGQWGPHYREFNGELEALRSSRYFLTLGIDIVVKRFY